VDEKRMRTINPAAYGQLLAAEFRQARELLENLTFADHDLSAC